MENDYQQQEITKTLAVAETHHHHRHQQQDQHDNHPASVSDAKQAASDSWGFNVPLEAGPGKEIGVRVSSERCTVVSADNRSSLDDGSGGHGCGNSGGVEIPSHENERDGRLSDLGGLTDEGEGAHERSEIGVQDEKSQEEGGPALSCKVESVTDRNDGISEERRRDGSKRDPGDENGGDKEAGELEEDKLKLPVKDDSNEEIMSSNSSISRRKRGRGESDKQEEETELKTGENSTKSAGGGDDHVHGHGMGFSVGDFVWGKIKSHPWWPGRIFDSSNASDYALTYKHEGRVLVGYFGDHSFAWCDFDQLKPFVEDFDELLRQSSSKGFSNAVEASLDEFGRLMELETACSCVSKDDNKIRYRSLVINAGVKEDTYVHEGGLGKFSIARVQPSEILAQLRSIACSVSACNPLHLMVLKSLLLAFFRAKGGGYTYPLQEHHEAEETGYLGDGIDDISKLSGPGGDEDELETSKINLLKGRKLKSIAEILGAETVMQRKKSFEEDDDTQREEESHSGKQAALSARKRRKTAGADDPSPGDDDILSSQIQRRKAIRRRLGRSALAAEIKESSRKQDDNVQNDNHNNLQLKRNLRIGGVEFENDGVAKETIELSPPPRERKKSKYLSPPYTTSLQLWQRASSRSDSEATAPDSSDHVSKMRRKRSSRRRPESAGLEFAGVAGMGQRMVKAASQLSGTSPKPKPPSKCSAPQVFQETLPVETATESDKPTDSDPQSPKGCSRSDIHEPRETSASSSKALDPANPSGGQGQGQSFDTTIKGFLSSYRSSKHKDGTEGNLQSEEKASQAQARRKSNIISQHKDGSETIDHKTQPRSAEGKMEDKLGSNGDSDLAETAGSSAVLKLSFPSDFSLPSKVDLTRIYSRFGALNELKTKLLPKTSSAEVFFVKSCDAEEALSSSQKNSPFGAGKVIYKLKHVGTKSKSKKVEILQPFVHKLKFDSSAQQSASKVDNGESSGSGLTFVKQKLEEIASILSATGGRMSPEIKSNLVVEMKELLGKLRE